MKNKRIVIYLIFWLFQIHRIYTFEDDEYYCQGVYDSYAYCRRCPNANGYCEAPRSCQCENIELYNNNPIPNANDPDEVVGYQGGANCEAYDVKDERSWCYVSEDSICNDKVQSEFGRGLRDEWFNKNLYWSYNACDSSKKVETGNEQFLPETRLTSKNLPDEYGGGGFLANTPEECQTECYVRLGKCGSWSFNMNTKICYLHESDACCNQLSKREVANEYMSGYNCPVCWSTRNDCPCSEDIRLNNFFKRFTSGGKMTENLSATSKLGVISRPNAARRRIWRWNGFRWQRIRSRKNDRIRRKCDDGNCKKKRTNKNTK